MPQAGGRAPRKIDGRLMRQMNRAIVLNLVRTDPTLSRAAIVRRTGLSPAAVSGIVEHLLREGLVREEGAASTGNVGRRPLRLALNPDARMALGIHIDVRQICAALVNLSGERGTVHEAPVPIGADPHTVLDLVARLARAATPAISPGALLGAGVAIPGMVSWPDGVNLFSPNFGWRDVPMRALLETHLGYPVLVDNEVRALALAEHHYGAARGARSALFLDAGFGVGGAVIIDGALYRGRHGAAGELGHNTVDPSGPRCSCGNRGCLEVFASISGLEARARAALAAGDRSTLTPERISFAALVAAAHAADPLACRLLDRAATYLGLAVANAIDNWDPELVVLSGPLIRESGGLLDTLLAAEQRSVLETGRACVRVVPAMFDGDVKIVGAATLMIADYLATPLGGADLAGWE